MSRGKTIDVALIAPTRTEYVTREVNVRENRAPTDASVALLNEMQAKARENILDTIKVGGNGFECVIQIDKEAMTEDLLAVAAFSLNGKSTKAHCRLEWRGQRGDKMRMDLFEKLRGEVATVIASELLASSWGGVVRYG